MFTFFLCNHLFKARQITVVYKCKVLNLVLYDTRFRHAHYNSRVLFFLINIITLSRGIQFSRASLDGALALQN